MPGVPPDAVDTLKRAFKGLFKRSKKPKSEASSTSASSYQPQAPTQLSVSSAAAPPQLPPVQNHSPIQGATQSATDTSKPLPPTHPLATGPRDEPIQAVQVNQDARPGPSEPAVGPTGGMDQVQEQQESIASPISPREPNSAMDGARDGETVPDDTTSQLPSKMDGAVEDVKKDDSASSEPAPINENSRPTATEEAPITNGDAPAETSSPLTATKSSEEKVAVMHEEAPPMPSIKPAPGMSATSGPLEDFPEGGDMRDT